MNKNLKKVIAIALTVSAVSATAPASVSNYNLLVEKAYAASSDESNDKDLSKISLSAGGRDIQLYSDSHYKNEDKVENDEVSDDGTYYAKSKKKTIKVSTSGPRSKFVRVFKGTSSSTKGYRTDKNINLSSGTNTITVKVYSEEPSSTPKLGDDDNVKATYKIKVKYTEKDSSSDNDQDKIYLDDISLDHGNISFDKNKSIYNIKVKSDVDEIEVKAKPEDTDYSVDIDGYSINEDDDWERKVNLEKGKNKIVIKVEDDDDNKRTYTLNITRGDVSTTPDSIYLDSLSVGATDLNLSENKKDWNLKFNSNVKKTYIIAEPKNSDYTVTIDGDKVDESDSYKKSVELEDGEVKTFKVKVEDGNGPAQIYTLNVGRGNVDFSVKNNNTNTNTNTNALPSTEKKNVGWFKDYATGNWYLYDIYGNQLTGWQPVGGKWYYMDPQTKAMKTGWIKSPSNEQWYYLNSSGAMVTNTYIGQFRIGPTGEWIK